MDIIKLAKVMQRTTSSNDNEALISIRKANMLLDKSGLMWDDFISQKQFIINVKESNLEYILSKVKIPKISKKFCVKLFSLQGFDTVLSSMLLVLFATFLFFFYLITIVFITDEYFSIFISLMLASFCMLLVKRWVL